MQYSENLTFKNVNCVPNDAKNRIFSGHDDGFHFLTQRKDFVDSCSFAGLMDDPINVHGTSVLITEKVNNKLLKCNLFTTSIGFKWAEPNDEVDLLKTNR
jgi:hypothetical protein